MNKLKIPRLLLMPLFLLLSSYATADTQNTIEPIPQDEALGYLTLRDVPMPGIQKAWKQHIDAYSGMPLSEYREVIKALYHDLTLSYEAYDACLQQVKERREKASDIWIKELQKRIPREKIIEHKAVIKKALGAMHLMAMTRACHEEEKTVVTRESYLTHAISEILKSQLVFIKSQSTDTQNALQEYTEKIGTRLQSLGHPVVRTTVAANGFNAHIYERTLETCQKQSPEIVGLLREMPSLQEPFDVFGAMDDLDSFSGSVP